MANPARQLLIVGAGMAAAYLVRELLARQSGWHVTVVGEEEDACYNRVLLSTVLAGETDESELAMLSDLPASVRILTGRRIVAIDWEQRVAVDQQGGRLAFDELVFATGAEPAIPAMPGLDANGVWALRTLADCRGLVAATRPGGRAIVVGGGLLGLEAAHGLNGLGWHTTVVHRRSTLMNRQLDPAGGLELRAVLESQGLHFDMQADLAAVHTRGSDVASVTLSDGRDRPCDLLIFATGILPSAALAVSAGIAVHRGILVDGWLRTSRPGVWALGECCQVGDHCFGLVAPVQAQAAVLAATLLGETVPAFESFSYATQLKISGVDIYSDGDLDGDAEDIVLRDPGAGIYRRLRVRDNKLVAVVLVGDRTGASWFSDLIHSAADISAFRPALMFGPTQPDRAQHAVSAAA